MGPLAEANARQHETIVGQAERLEVLAEANGRLMEQVVNRDRELLRSTAELEQARRERDATEAARRRAYRLASLIFAVVATLAIAATPAPSWVR